MQWCNDKTKRYNLNKQYNNKVERQEKNHLGTVSRNKRYQGRGEDVGLKMFYSIETAPLILMHLQNTNTSMNSARVKDPLPYQWNTTVTHTRVLQKVLSLGSDYFNATFYQTYFYYKPSMYSPFTETHFCNLFTQSRKADK